MEIQCAHNISEVCALSRASRTVVYEAINSGELVAHKRGRRTIVLTDDLRRWLENLPVVAPKANLSKNHSGLPDTSALARVKSALCDHGCAAEPSTRRRKVVA
jgi:excisionase family DNA binding protein